MGSGKLSSRTVMKNAVFAREVLKKRVCPSVVDEIFELGTLPLELSFSLFSFPQIQTASLRGRTGLQCVTKLETSEGSRRNA
jgi:hypothetical protein